MSYIFANLKYEVVLFHNVAYDDRVVHHEINNEKVFANSIYFFT